MTLLVVDIPEPAAELKSWLERHIVSDLLGNLVSELIAIHGDSGETYKAAAQHLEQLLGGQQSVVIERGLGVLDAEKLQQLLSRPRLLFALQELVFVEGGQYWLELLGAAPFDQGIQAETKRRVLRDISIELAVPVPTALPVAAPTVQLAIRRTLFSRPWFASILTAALVLIAVFVALPTPEQDVARVTWGWDKPGALPENVSRRMYLTTLAAGAQQWFNPNAKVDTPQALARRIIQFRQGCSTLILAEHSRLAQVDRDWLVERCQIWAKALDGHLADIEAGKPIDNVRQAANTTIQKLIDTITGRSTGLA